MIRSVNDLYERVQFNKIDFSDKQVYFTRLDRSNGKQDANASSEGCTLYDKSLGAS